MPEQATQACTWLLTWQARWSIHGGARLGQHRDFTWLLMEQEVRSRTCCPGESTVISPPLLPFHPPPSVRTSAGPPRACCQD